MASFRDLGSKFDLTRLQTTLSLIKPTKPKLYLKQLWVQKNHCCSSARMGLVLNNFWKFLCYSIKQARIEEHKISSNQN